MSKDWYCDPSVLRSSTSSFGFCSQTTTSEMLAIVLQILNLEIGNEDWAVSIRMYQTAATQNTADVQKSRHR